MLGRLMLLLGLLLPVFHPAIQQGCAVDGDADGVEMSQDCDDSDASVFPGAAELCDDKDNNCSGGSGDLYVSQVDAADTTTINEAVALAADGCSIEVAPGTYFEQLLINKMIDLRSESGIPEDTIIDAQYQDRVIMILSTTATVAGFTLTKGQPYNANGAGVYILDSTATLDNIIVTGNMAVDTFDQEGVGGGVSVDNSIVDIYHSEIRKNTSDAGGGIYCLFSQMNVDDSIISENVGIFWAGGSMLYDCNGSFTQSVISHNRVERNSGPGGIGLYWHSSPSFTNVIINGNVGGESSGSGVDLQDGGSVFTNCVIANNSGGQQSAGVRVDDVAGYDDYITAPVFRNTVVAYNSNSNFKIGDDTEVTLQYTGVYNPSGMNGNVVLDSTSLTVEPKFASYANGYPIDFHLASDSPLINVGDPAQLYYDSDGSRNDIGAYGGPDGAW